MIVQISVKWLITNVASLLSWNVLYVELWFIWQLYEVLYIMVNSSVFHVNKHKKKLFEEQHWLLMQELKLYLIQYFKYLEIWYTTTLDYFYSTKLLTNSLQSIITLQVLLMQTISIAEIKCIAIVSRQISD